MTKMTTKKSKPKNKQTSKIMEALFLMKTFIVLLNSYFFNPTPLRIIFMNQQ